MLLLFCGGGIVLTFFLLFVFLLFFFFFFFFFISFWQEDRSCQERPKHVNQRSQRPLQKQREESEKVL